MACDICGKNTEVLETIKDQYQTDEIKQICSTCCNDINDHIWELTKMMNKLNDSWTKRFMVAMKHKFSSK